MNEETREKGNKNKRKIKRGNNTRSSRLTQDYGLRHVFFMSDKNEKKLCRCHTFLCVFGTNEETKMRRPQKFRGNEIGCDEFV